MVCPKCGSINPDAQKFCTGCGTELTIFYQQQQQYLQRQQQQQLQQQSFQQPQSDYLAAQDAPTAALYDEPIQNFDYPQTPEYSPIPDNALPNQENPHKAMGIISLILGIFALVNGIVGIILGCIPLVGLIISILGLICGAVSIPLGKKSGRKIGVAIAGLVCSTIPLALNIVLLIIGTSLSAMFN